MSFARRKKRDAVANGDGRRPRTSAAKAFSFSATASPTPFEKGGSEDRRTVRPGRGDGQRQEDGSFALCAGGVLQESAAPGRLYLPKRQKNDAFHNEKLEHGLVRAVGGGVGACEGTEEQRKKRKVLEKRARAPSQGQPKGSLSTATNTAAIRKRPRFLGPKTTAYARNSLVAT